MAKVEEGTEAVEMEAGMEVAVLGEEEPGVRMERGSKEVAAMMVQEAAAGGMASSPLA